MLSATLVGDTFTFLNTLSLRANQRFQTRHNTIKDERSFSVGVFPQEEDAKLNSDERNCKISSIVSGNLEFIATMYHPSRGGVRGGRDQFNWDDVKVDKYRENYIGHSLKAPVGRWQKGKDLHWYSRDKKSKEADMEAAKEEIRRIKEEEEQAMREALGLAPKRSSKPQANRLDKHEFSELVKRGSTAEDLGAGHAEAAHVQGLGFAKAPKAWEESSSLQPVVTMEAPKNANANANVFESPSARGDANVDSEDESSKKKRKREEKKKEKHERREERKHEKYEKRDERKHERREKRHDDDRRHKRDKGKRRHDSD